MTCSVRRRKQRRARVADRIELTIPSRPDYHRVAHLVVGGLAARLQLTLETLEDLQLALDAILDRTDGEQPLTLALSLDDGTLETRVGPVDDALRAELTRESGDELGLRRVLETTVDSVDLDGDDIRLTKKVRAHG
jgi:hypothetical protein